MCNGYDSENIRQKMEKIEIAVEDVDVTSDDDVGRHEIEMEEPITILSHDVQSVYN